MLNLWQHVWRKSISEVDHFVGSNNGQGSGSGSRGGSAGGSDNDVDNLEQERVRFCTSTSIPKALKKEREKRGGREEDEWDLRIFGTPSFA